MTIRFQAGSGALFSPTNTGHCLFRMTEMLKFCSKLRLHVTPANLDLQPAQTFDLHSAPAVGSANEGYFMLVHYPMFM